MKKRLVCLLLTLTMAFLCVPAGIFAEEEDIVVAEEVIEAPADEAPVVDEEPADDEPADEDPVIEEPIVEEPIDEEPEAEEPAVEEPEAEEPEAEEPETEEPVSEESKEEGSEEEEPAVQEPVEEETPIFEIKNDTLVHYNGEDEEVTVPDGIRVIGTKAFSGNKTIKKVILPESVEIIKNYAFEECSSLEEVAFVGENNLDTICKGAFLNDTLLDISFADDVKHIIETAFDGIPVKEEVEIEESIIDEETADETAAEDAADQEAAAEEVTLEKAFACLVSITAEPQDVVGALNEKVTISVTASNVANYQWQYSTDNGATWKNSGGTAAKTNTMSFTISASTLAMLRRCEMTDANGEKKWSRIVKTTEKSSIVINSEPEDVAGAMNERVTISVDADNVASYQWQYSTDGGETWKNSSGTAAKTDTLSFTISATSIAMLRRCEMTDANGLKAWTRNVTTSERQECAVVINSEPEDVAGAMNDRVTISVDADNVASYQWQYSTDDGATWKNSGGTAAKTDTMSFTISATTLAMLRRCEMTDANGLKAWTRNVTTSELQECAVVINSEPEDVAGAMNDRVTISVDADNVASYQWQYSTDDGATWKNSSGTAAKTATLTFTISATTIAMLRRCEMTDANGLKAWTRNVTTSELQECAVVINSEPEDVAGAMNDRVTISVDADNVASYQWQYSTDDGATWKNSSGTAAKTDTLTFTISATTIAMLRRCEMTDANGLKAWTRNVATSERLECAIVINSEPEDAEGAMNERVTISVDADNVESYQWQYSTDDGETWKNSSGTAAKTDTLSFTINASAIAMLRRCEMTDANGLKAWTRIVVTSEKCQVVINSEPEDAEGAMNERVTISVDADNVASYQWQYSTDDGETWKNSSGTAAKTDTLSFTISATTIAMLRRCEMTDANGKKAWTRIVTTSEKCLVVINSEPEDVEGMLNDRVTISVDADNVASYQWQYSTDDGETWKNSSGTAAKTDTLSFTISATTIAMLRRCELTDANGKKTWTRNVTTSETQGFVVDGVTYVILSNTSTVKTVMITAYDSTSTEPVIPETVNGFTVTEIGEEAFMGKGITSIALPSTITIIHARAFKNCTSLATMTQSN